MKRVMTGWRRAVRTLWEKMTAHAAAGQKVTALLLAAAVLGEVLFSRPLPAAVLVLLLCSPVWHAAGKGEEKNFRLLCLCLGEGCVWAALLPGCALRRIAPGAALSSRILDLMCLAVLGTGLAVLSRSRLWKEVFGRLRSWHLTGEGTEPEQKLEKGDVVICQSKEKLESGAGDARVILPAKDRYLHMLILGPTGSGKTSQVILPMVRQDILNLETGVTVLEPKGDLAREVAMMAEAAGREYIYLDPSVDNCPHFNPLAGNEADIIENAVTTFLMLNPDAPQYFKDLHEQLLRNSLKVLKRLDRAEGRDGYYANFITLDAFISNSKRMGTDLMAKFSRIPAPEAEQKENADIAAWFTGEYFKERSKVYENASGIRAQVAKITASPYLRRVLNPDWVKGERSEIDFERHLAEGGVICISTAQGLLRELGRFLGYFLILQFQSAVFRRPGNEDTRRAHCLYIDEFQTYCTPGFGDLLTQGRSYRVACHLATQARAQMAMGGGRDGKNFVELVSTNARNIIIFPGASKDDARYYSEQFGMYEKEEETVSRTRKEFSLLPGGLQAPSVSVRRDRKLVPRFTPTDLIYRPFGEIVYCIVKDSTVQTPGVGVVQWLDREYDLMLKRMAEERIVSHEFRIGPDMNSSPDGEPEEDGTDWEGAPEDRDAGLDIEEDEET